MTMLNEAALGHILSTAAQQFNRHDSDIARYLSSILSEVEVKNSVETPTSVPVCSARMQSIPAVHRSEAL